MKQIVFVAGMVAITTALMAGCSSNKQQPTGEETGQPTPLTIVDREYSVAWDNYGRGGAALRQPGYIHVIGGGSFYGEVDTTNGSGGEHIDLPSGGAKQNELLTEALRLARGSSKAPDAFSGRPSPTNGISTGGPRSFTFYELSRWERFCRDGKGMDERDWMFVDEEGYKNAPMEAFDNCSPPNHGYSDYLKAWERFCTSNSPTELDLRIVKNSVRPFSTVNPCAAIHETE